MATSLILDRYQYVRRLGSGGSSTVLLAEDTLLKRRVALKRVHATGDSTARSRLRREALIGASLGHPNLVSIFDIVTPEDGEDVIVMEYVDGETLADRLRPGEKLQVDDALAIVDGVAAALDAIHGRGIIHRDVKPANVLLKTDGSVKLADLGIASVTDGTQITTGDAVLGTFRYMAPEQLEGADATPAIDVYALAAVAFEALSGEKARHEPNPLALAHAIATQPPPDLRAVWPEAPNAAAQVLKRGMSRDPARRQRSAGELAAGLRAALEPQPTKMLAGAVAAPEQAKRPAGPLIVEDRRRSRGALVALLATLVAAAAVAAIVASSLGSSHQRLASRSATHGAVAGPTVHQSARSKSSHHKAAHTATSSTSSGQGSSSGSASGTTSTGSASGTTPPPPTVPVVQSSSGAASGASPVNAVESFYHLAASHQYAAAWGLADAAFRQQMQGYYGLQATMAQERAIIFDGASVVNESPSSATVAVRTTSVRSNGSQSCAGTVNVLRAGSAEWLLDHINIQCA